MLRAQPVVQYSLKNHAKASAVQPRGAISGRGRTNGRELHRTQLKEQRTACDLNKVLNSHT